MGKIKVIAFDKTGTLTKGQPVVTDIIALNGTEDEILELAYSVEHFSEHPLARAIVWKAETSGINNSVATNFSALTGYGATAKVRNKTCYVGNQRLFHKLGQDIYSIPQIEELRNDGKTVILVGTEEAVTGIIAIRDEI
ncbi:MAG: HAD family hydrolase [Fidelibacterota bacterium]